MICEGRLLSWAWMWADRSDNSNKNRRSENSRFIFLWYRMYIHRQSVLCRCNCGFLSYIDLLKNIYKWHFLSLPVSNGTSPTQTNREWPWLFRLSLCFGQAAEENYLTCLFVFHNNWLIRYRIPKGELMLSVLNCRVWQGQHRAGHSDCSFAQWRSSY